MHGGAAVQRAGAAGSSRDSLCLHGGIAAVCAGDAGGGRTASHLYDWLLDTGYGGIPIYLQQDGGVCAVQGDSRAEKDYKDPTASGKKFYKIHKKSLSKTKRLE